MKLTVDASIAVKWYVAEPLHGEARRLLSHRLRLNAPDILLAEFANTIWKKARKGELDDPQPYFDELALLRVTPEVRLTRFSRVSPRSVPSRPPSSPKQIRHVPEHHR